MYLKKLTYRFYSSFKCAKTAKVSLSKSNHKIDPSLQNFFQNMKRVNRISPGIVSFRVIGSGAPGTPKSLYMFTDQSRYLFNCGEGTQRISHENKLKISCLEHLFVTSAKWENIGGLFGLCLTLQDGGINKIRIHGPPGIKELFTATQKFVVLSKMQIEPIDCKSEVDFEDSVMSVKYVALESKHSEKNIRDDSLTDIKDPVIEDDTDYYSHEIVNKRFIKNDEMNELLQEPRRELFYSICFICRLKSRPGMLNLQKCVDKGIKPGPMLGLLKDGQDVTLPDGTIVLAKDVKNPDDPGNVFIVIDVPDMSYLDSLIENESFRMYQEKTAVNPQCAPTIIFHFTPDDIIQTEKYQNFIKSFSPTTNHMILNNTNTCNASLAIHRSQCHLNMLNNEIFPLLLTHQYDNNISKENVHNCRALTGFYLRPTVNLDRTHEIELKHEEWLTEPYASPHFETSLQNFLKTCNTLKKSDKEYPKIVFLGTGSCIPNKTRNTSCILVHIDENNSIILDCGEGTYGQLVRFYGIEKIDQVMKNLKAVYISHLHADHHLGLINILQYRRKSLNKLYGEDSYKDKHIYLIAPKQIMSYLCLYDRRFERIFNEFKLFPNCDLVKSDAPMLEALMDHTNLLNIETCYVKHCPNAYGISITTKDMVKITYSGDTMPCSNLVDIGKDSDILIHEATMEDDLESEARRKFHSTIQQAVDIGEEMKANYTILTHFSQRYARVPRISSQLEENMLSKKICIAFDNMEIAYKNLQILPHMYPVLKNLFAEHYDELNFKAAKRAAKKEISALAKKQNIEIELKL